MSAAIPPWLDRLFVGRRRALPRTARPPVLIRLRRALGRLPAAAPAAVLLPLATILVLAGITHLVSVLAMPTLAERSAYQRLSDIARPNTLTFLPDASPSGMVLPMTDPAFVSAVCLYDLGDHPLRVRVPATADYTSVSFYTSRGVAFYALSDQAAGRVIELDLLSPAQRAALPEDEEITAADRLVVESPSLRGVVLVRAYARYNDTRPAIRRQLEAASCMPS
ncbi:DUF1254 domain-containing protein [Aquabacter spiritensis]|uniref:Putative membrane protein n=1 Tax=Aquabacter spiritensis TaxID=933073 RepID=A0A4R3LSK6_9HYPH|nr:DUF1254 domain-containing protein [Aquabacter spiritensis]TCT03543.1 putative membrane protein [Aquabacter spiritensis]